MNISDLQFVFNRALTLSLSRKKLILTSVVLAFCGLLVVFFRGLAIGASHWVMLSLTFLPFFLCAGILLSMGIVLIRIYHNEIKQRPVSYREILRKSWAIVIGASYFSIPIILSYLLLWIFLGIFLLLRLTPGVGEVIGVILAFGPFILNLGTLILCLLNLAMLFFVTPIIAFKGLNRIQVTQTLIDRLKSDPFSNIIYGLFALLPLLFVGGLLVLAAFMTETVCYICADPLHNVLQWFFIMIPFTAALSPAVVFYFNFAAEAHVLMQKSRKDKGKQNTI